MAPTRRSMISPGVPRHPRGWTPALLGVHGTGQLHGAFPISR
jgi:hypothetical protein